MSTKLEHTSSHELSRTCTGFLEDQECVDTGGTRKNSEQSQEGVGPLDAHSVRTDAAEHGPEEQGQGHEGDAESRSDVRRFILAKAEIHRVLQCQRWSQHNREDVAKQQDAPPDDGNYKARNAR
eukprot:5098932-Prymnesium_polylepis.1